MFENLRRQSRRRMGVCDVREQTKARATLASIANATYYVFIWDSRTGKHFL